MVRPTVRIEPVADGFEVTSSAMGVTASGRTATAAWSAFMVAVQARWIPPSDEQPADQADQAGPAEGRVATGGGLRSHITTIRRTDLFG